MTIWDRCVDVVLMVVCILVFAPLMVWAAFYPRLNHNGWSPLFYYAPLTFDGFGEADCAPPAGEPGGQT